MPGGNQPAATFDQHPLTRERLTSIGPTVAGHRTDLHWHIWLSDGPDYARELTADAARRLAADLLRYAELVDHGALAADAAT